MCSSDLFPSHDIARGVLDLSVEELVNRTDLEEETILEVIRILKSEFE